MRDDEGKPVVTIPLVVRLAIVRVQPATIVIAIGIEQFRIAVRIARNIAHTTARPNTQASRTLSGMLNALISRAKYLRF